MYAVWNTTRQHWATRIDAPFPTMVQALKWLSRPNEKRWNDFLSRHDIQPDAYEIRQIKQETQ
jgi:hypothetical protein